MTPPLDILSAAEQVASHLRTELMNQRWGVDLPGVHHLAREIGVNHKTVEAAVHLLESEGYLEGRGPGRRRRIVRVEGVPHRSLRVGILQYDNYAEPYDVHLFHELREAGHTLVTPPYPQAKLDHDTRRIARMIEKHPADAWIVFAGSRSLLEWFAERPQPTFAFFGRRSGLPIAGVGPDKYSAYADVARHLVELGHKRIVLLSQHPAREGRPTSAERHFLEELEAHGVATGDYHVPKWEGTADGFHAVLESLFELTPPTALLLDEAHLFVAAMQFAAGRGIRVPEDLSLVCTDPDPSFQWCRPEVSHIAWDPAPLVRRVVQWVAGVKRGKVDTRQEMKPARFVVGGTAGPAA